MSDEEREKMRDWVNNWKETGTVLEKLRGEEVKQSFEVLTNLRGMWVATPWDYSSSRWIKFHPNQEAKLCYGYGQTIYAVINAEFEIPDIKTLNLSYLESPSVAFFKGFKPQKEESKEFFFLLCEEENTFTKSITRQTVSYRWKLTFSESIFPDEINFPYESPLEFYGHRIC